jgi:integrase
MCDDLVREFLLYRFESGLCWQTVNSDYSSIQKYFKNVLFLPWSLKKLPRPKKERMLPSILSREDIIRIIESASTYKLQVILTFIYVTGARLSETINIKIEDIEGNRNQIRINKGKGNKDRIILVPPLLIRLLREYYLKERPVKYLFNSFEKGRKYSPRSIQRAVFESKKKANILKKGSVHTLRNCYATHHLEGGTDLVFLQEQMGHKNIKTTIRYIGLCVERQRFINHPIQSMQIKYRV